MSSHQSFQNSALITGSTDYYRLLFLEGEDKQRALHLLEIIQRMEQLISHSDETQLHLTRVNWWQQQFKLMEDQKATLPATQHLQVLMSDASFNHQLLEQALQAISDEFFLKSFSDNEQQKAWCQRRFGMCNMAMAQLLGADTECISDFIQLTAEVEGICYLLKQQSFFLVNKVVPFSKELLAGLSLSSEQLLDSKNSEAHQKIAQQLKVMAENSWQDALKKLPDDQAIKLLPILINCEIKIKWLKKIEKSGFPLYDPSIDVLAIKKFWLAWRWHRKAVNLCK